MSFEGKVVLITGGGSGIGADAARHLAKLGAKVSIVDRNEKRLNEVAEEIKHSGASEPLAIVADITIDAERIVNDTIKHFSKLDVLLNNAGIGSRDSVDVVDISEFDRIFDTNVRSVITLTKLCVPFLEKSKGNVVNISSVAGMKPMERLMSYCMSKAALDQFTKCSASDLAPKGIRVNSVNPSAIRTPIFETSGATSEEMKQFLDRLKKKHPVGRIGEVPDTSAAIAYLADNNTSSFITGILLPVDGGLMVVGEI